MRLKYAGLSFLGEPVKQLVVDSVTGSVAFTKATAAPRLVSAIPMDTTPFQLPTTPAAAVVGTTAAAPLVPGSIGITLSMAPVPIGAPNLPTAPAPIAAVMVGKTEEDDDDDEEDEDSVSTTLEPQRQRRKIDPVSQLSLARLNFLQILLRIVLNFPLTPAMVSLIGQVKFPIFFNTAPQNLYIVNLVWVDTKEIE